MIWSRYNRIIKSSVGTGYILFNSMSQTLLEIDNENIEAFRFLENNPDSYEEFENSQFLIEAKIIVENDDDLLSHHIDTILKNRYNPNDISLTIAVTRDCNFSCAYCYETERPALYLSEKTEDDILAFLKSKKQLRSVFVAWYGGEPLLNFKCIQRLTNKIKNLGVQYAAMIVTNGYLLTESVRNQLKDLSIYKIQVTLDGPKHIHDKRRNRKDGKGTYDRIISNLKELVVSYPELQIDIRTNIDKSIESEYTKFYKELKTIFGSNNVKPYAGFASDMMNIGCVSLDNSFHTNVDKANFYIQNHNSNVDINSYMPQRHITTCIANSMTGLVIGPEGEVYKCWLVIGMPEFIIGNIAEPEKFDVIKLAKYTCSTDYIFDNKCRECFFIPVCSGGCPLARILNKEQNRNIETCYMIKDYLQQYLEFHIELMNNPEKDNYVLE